MPAKTISDQQKEDLESYIAIKSRTSVECEECGEECKAGEPMWNGWFCHMGAYHLKCVPQHIKEKYGIRS